MADETSVWIVEREFLVPETEYVPVCQVPRRTKAEAEKLLREFCALPHQYRVAEYRRVPEEPKCKG